jgi:outer membrane protein, multidrug efflux system
MLLLAGLLLGGCAAVGPDYKRPDDSLPATWHNTAGGSTTNRAEDISHWWKRLNDPLLDQFIGESLVASPDLLAARAKLREARARRELAGAEVLPSVTASASASRSKSSGQTGTGTTRNLFSAAFDASWEPDIFGATRRGIEAAQADLETSTASLDGVRVSLVAEVALNYVDLRAYQARLGIARANLASQTETLQIADWRNQAGLATALDVEQARANLEQTRAQIPALETNLAQTEHQLAILLGKAPGDLHERLAAPAALPQIANSVATGIPADILRRRPDVVVAERKLAAETARIGVATAALYPGFQLSGSIGLDALNPADLLTRAAISRSLAASVVGTLFDGGRLRKHVEIQNAVQEQALVSYQTTLLTALKDVENALVALANSGQRREALSRAAEAAGNAATLARQRYASGLVDFQTVLDSERSLLSTQDSLASADAERVTALIQLYKALGGGWPSPDSATESHSNPQRSNS